MQLIFSQEAKRRFGILMVLGLGAVFAPAPSTAMNLGVDEQSAQYLFQIFADADDIHVYSNYGNYDLLFENEARIALRFNHETVIVPAVDAPVGSAESVDAITTASRPIRDIGDAYNDFRKKRDEVQGDFIYRGASAGYYMSVETDYFAQQVRGSYNRDFLDQNFNLAVAASYGWDDIKPLLDQDTVAANDFRNTTHVSAVATQVITPVTLLRLGAEVSSVSGLQHNPYRNVYVDGANVAELHPNERSRRDVFVKVSQYLTNQSSLKLDYKYYTDDWGIDSHTVGARLNQYVTSNLTVRYRYRYYDQSSADFFRDEYIQPGGVNGFQSGDYRMGEFTAHLFGTKIEWSLAGIFSDSDLWSQLKIRFNYERYFNSNNFSANIFESGFALAF